MRGGAQGKGNFGNAVDRQIFVAVRAMSDWRNPILSGEHLAGELEELSINGHELAKRLKLPFNRIYQILRGKRSISAFTALRLWNFLMLTLKSG